MTTTTTAPAPTAPTTPRVRSTALVARDDGRSWFAGAPFSGLAYRVDDDGVVQAIDVFRDGRPSGVSDDWLDVPPGGARVVVERLDSEDEYGPFLWRGAPLDGVVYVFHPAGPCTAEEVYRGGLPSEDDRRAWYLSGALRQRVRGDEGTSWFEDGRLESKGNLTTTFLNLVVRDDGRLAGVTLRDATLFDLASTARIPLADELFLIGSAIDTAWLAAFRDRTALAAVARLHLVGTSAGPDVVDLLAGLEGPRELSLEKNPALGRQDAERLRARRPDCAVRFEPADADA